VCFSKPDYSSAGFISSIERKDSIHTFPKDGKLRISSFYDNSKNYGKVMSLAATYSSVIFPGTTDPESDLRRTQWAARQGKELEAVLNLFNSAIQVPGFSGV